MQNLAELTKKEQTFTGLVIWPERWKTTVVKGAVGILNILGYDGRGVETARARYLEHVRKWQAT